MSFAYFRWTWCGERGGDGRGFPVKGYRLRGVGDHEFHRRGSRNRPGIHSRAFARFAGDKLRRFNTRDIEAGGRRGGRLIWHFIDCCWWQRRGLFRRLKLRLCRPHSNHPEVHYGWPAFWLAGGVAAVGGGSGGLLASASVA
jgi:hypothetical protein